MIAAYYWLCLHHQSKEWLGQHGGIVAGATASQLLQAFVCWVSMLSPWLCGFPLGDQVSPTIKSIQARLINSGGATKASAAQIDPPSGLAISLYKRLDNDK